MAIYFKFKNVKKWETLNFESSVISVLEVKRGIVRHKKLDQTNDDFDLMLSNAQTGELYKDDAYLIPKNTSVVVKRIPAKKQRSLVLKAPPETLFTSSDQTSNIPQLGQTTGSAEERQMLELAQQASSQMYVSLSLLFIIYRSGDPSSGHNRAPMGQPPPGYVCFRCNVPGHHIQDCPTNGDPSYDLKKSFPPIGIPRSFLKTVDAPVDSSDGTAPRGMLDLGEGKYAYAEANETAFRQTHSNRLQTAAAAFSDSSSHVNSSLPKEFVCPLCRKLLVSPSVLPCCFSSFCDECIRQQLIVDTNGACPVCRAENMSPEDLKPNKRLEERVEEYKVNNPLERHMSPVTPFDDQSDAGAGLMQRGVRKRFKCEFCGRTGHTEDRCFSKQRQSGPKYNSQPQRRDRSPSRDDRFQDRRSQSRQSEQREYPRSRDGGYGRVAGNERDDLHRRERSRDRRDQRYGSDLGRGAPLFTPRGQDRERRQ